MIRGGVFAASLASLSRLAAMPWLLVAVSPGCSGERARLPILQVDMPLHLEDHLDAAVIAGSELPYDLPATVEWRFDEPQPEWKAGLPHLDWPTTLVERTSAALRVTLPEGRRDGNGSLHGSIYIDLPDWRPRDWAHVLVRARTSSSVHSMLLGLNPREYPVPSNATQATFQLNGGITPIVRDGSVQTYLVRPNWGNANGRPGTWRRLGLGFFAPEPGSIEILSVRIVPTAALYAEASPGVRSVSVGDAYRRSLVISVPGRLAYRVLVPEGGRLDAGLGVQVDGEPVAFRVAVQTGGEQEVLFEERYADSERWAQRSVDLSQYAGQTVTLALETEADRSGTFAFWGSPTVSTGRTSGRPNVIFYVIDGGAADQMSVYGYNRRTTPNLERLAAEGALFEHAYSNSSWSKPSTTSFMTSLHSSVLGNVGGRFEPLPVEARTMAERFHEAGYPTAVFTSNAWAGSASSLERGVDVFRDLGVRPPSGSSVQLHRDFLDWRATSPGEPYWVHFQTTDVHSPLRPPAPFAGLFASPEQRTRGASRDSIMNEWSQRNQLRLGAEPNWWRTVWAETGIDRTEHNDLYRSLYDESMANQDYQLGRLIQQLEETGQWENTLLVIAGDHSLWAGSEDFPVLMQDSLPPAWQLPILRSSVSRVPLIFVWPGHIVGGQRFSHPVSMIDVLPTVLELTGLPPLDVLQGQSLAPLLLGQAGWQPRPVIFDEFERDPRTGELRGRIEMIDGRWGASLWIGPPGNSPNHRPTPLLLFDVWNDPLALRLMNDAHLDLVAKYTTLLEEQWEAHQLLARRFTVGAEVALTPEQLETLRSLGYIR